MGTGFFHGQTGEECIFFCTPPVDYEPYFFGLGAVWKSMVRLTGGKIIQSKRLCTLCTYVPLYVGRDEEDIRKYIKEQEAEDRRLDQLNLFK